LEKIVAKYSIVFSADINQFAQADAYVPATFRSDEVNKVIPIQVYLSFKHRYRVCLDYGSRIADQILWNERSRCIREDGR
jgi:hypothetical protein